MSKYACILLLSFLVPTGVFSEEMNRYGMIELKGSVNPVIAEHIVDSIKKANTDRLQFIIIRMDTPGGLVNPMKDIIMSIMGSEIPVIVFTAPKGAQAASAGGFIMLSAHIAVMAPGTRIGAMSPVSLFGGELQGDMRKKVFNDLLAYARSLAQKRNRNVQWTERAVTGAISNTYLEAKKLGIIDLVAEDMVDLLKQLNGMSVNTGHGKVTLNTENARQISYTMGWQERFLNFFADPSVFYILLAIAVIGIWIEVKSPGLIVPGTVGAVAFFLFLMAMRVLPINFAGLALIIVAIVLFILELKVMSYGLLTAGGIASFIIGSMILFDTPLPGFQIPLSTIIGVVLVIVLFVALVLRSVMRTHAGKVTTGSQGMIGEKGTAFRDFNGEKGKVTVHGEIWNALTDDVLKKGDECTVTSIEGMVVTVKKS